MVVCIRSPMMLVLSRLLTARRGWVALLSACLNAGAVTLSLEAAAARPCGCLQWHLKLQPLLCGPHAVAAAKTHANLLNTLKNASALTWCPGSVESVSIACAWQIRKQLTMRDAIMCWHQPFSLTECVQLEANADCI
jgi:hypothetical protein